MKRHATILVHLVMVSMVLCAVGCGSVRMRPSGVHRDAQLLGGGTSVSFTAPANGIMYVVNAENNTLMATKQMKDGEVANIEPGSPELVKLKYGQQPPEEAAGDLPMRMHVYFVTLDALHAGIEAEAVQDPDAEK